MSPLSKLQHLMHRRAEALALVPVMSTHEGAEQMRKVVEAYDRMIAAIRPILTVP